MPCYNFMPCLVQSCHFVSFYATSCYFMSCWFLFYLLTAACVVVVMQEKPAISWHDQDPQLELKIPHLASHLSVHSLELHLSAHWCWASAQHRALISNICIKNIKKYHYNINDVKADYKKSRNLLHVILVNVLYLFFPSAFRVISKARQTLARATIVKKFMLLLLKLAKLVLKICSHTFFYILKFLSRVNWRSYTIVVFVAEDLNLKIDIIW